MSAEVVNFQKMGRRKAIARLTKNYSSILAHIMAKSMLDDGGHVDENDLPMVRPLDRTESRHGAVANAAIFFAGLMNARMRMEPLPDDGCEFGLYGFAYRAAVRAKRYHAENLGTYRILINGRYKRDLQGVELAYSGQIFAALRIEAVNDPSFDEAEFWADVFRGFSDSDPSGVVLRAAGLVLLDHLPQFRDALAAHTHGAALRA